MTKLDERSQRSGEEATLHPVTFHVPEPGDTVVAIVFLVGLAAVSAFTGYIATSFDGAKRTAFLSVALFLFFVAIVVPVLARMRSRRKGEIVIDPVRGEIRIARSYEIPFSSVRRVEVVEHEYTYRAINSSHEVVSADMKGWAIDIGMGRYLFGQTSLSRERVTEIADALRARVEAYRARTREGLARLPRPDPVLVEPMSGVLRQESETHAT